MSRFAFCVVMFFATAGLALGDPLRSITVVGVGTARVQPTYVVISGRSRGGGETAAEAKEEFQKTKETIQKAMDESDIERFTFEFKGEKVTTKSAGAADVAVAVFPGDGAEPATEGFTISERVELRIAFENDMQRTTILADVAGLMDRASEAGVQFGGQSTLVQATYGLTESIVQFGLEDESKLRAKAYRAAMQDARTRADLLAELAGAKLGAVVSIEEIEGLQSGESLQAMMFGAAFGDDEKHESEKLMTEENQSIELAQRLRIVFALQD